jgi:hypothetical protein
MNERGGHSLSLRVKTIRSPSIALSASDRTVKGGGLALGVRVGTGVGRAVASGLPVDASEVVVVGAGVAVGLTVANGPDWQLTTRTAAKPISCPSRIGIAFGVSISMS